MKEKVKIDGCEAERYHYLIANLPFFFFMIPGPESGPQKNIGILSCPLGCDKIKGSKKANHRGGMARADHETDIRLDFYLRELNGVPTKIKGFDPPIQKDHRCSPRFIDRTVPHEKELDL
jgi:hypothetical protein